MTVRIVVVKTFGMTMGCLTKKELAVHLFLREA